MAHHQSPTLVSVIIVSWNRREDLAVALASVRRQDYPSLEIVVVDNGSEDGTVEMLRSGACGPLTLYRAERNLGASVARNIGLKVARGEFVAFMDSDAELLSPTDISNLVRAIQARPNVGAIAPAIYTDAERKEPWFFGGYYLRGLYCDTVRTRKDHENPEYLSTCFSIWRKRLVDELGGFDPSLPYGFEDNDLSHRLLRAGHTLVVEMSVAVRHHLSQASRIRAEKEGWSHFRYDERARNLLQLRRLGLFGYLKEEAWQWTREGRSQRYHIYLHAPLRRRHKLALYTLVPVTTVCEWIFGLNRNRNYLDGTAIETARIERIDRAPSE
jgi:GT2 family glycosyltransferase